MAEAKGREKVTIKVLREMKSAKEPAVAVTAYNVWQGNLAEAAGMDWVLVGDSMGMTELGYSSTLPVTMEAMLLHTEAVAKSVKTPFLVGDMPYMSYQISNETAVWNASRFIVAGCDAVKMEGCLPERIAAIADAGILVMGHLGLTPQSTATFGGYKVQGNTVNGANDVYEMAKKVQDAGACAILLEAMPPEAGEMIASNLHIPIYGIGAGNKTDGQLVIFHDLTGLFFAFKPKFAKRYVDGGSLLLQGLNEYVRDTRSGAFPFPENMYTMKKGETLS